MRAVGTLARDAVKGLERKPFSAYSMSPKSEFTAFSLRPIVSHDIKNNRILKLWKHSWLVDLPNFYFKELKSYHFLSYYNPKP